MADFYLFVGVFLGLSRDWEKTKEPFDALTDIVPFWSINFPEINAGSGIDSHPTQALSDLKTLKEKFNDFKNLKVSIVGDLLHSRVANSFIEAFGKYNLKTNLFSPPYFKPKKIDFSKVIFY